MRQDHIEIPRQISAVRKRQLTVRTSKGKDNQQAQKAKTTQKAALLMLGAAIRLQRAVIQALAQENCSDTPFN